MSQQAPPERRNMFSKLYHWIVDGLERTVFLGIKYTYPKRFVSPLGYLGVLTGITFLVLGITGGLLMIYYEPSVANCGTASNAFTCAFASVENINNTITGGWLLRNIHYTASNAMVVLAVLHLYYQYFSGRFKIKNELLWVTGVLLGFITVGEAFTGYDLILSQRAGLAIEIGASLINSSPVIGGPLRFATFGASFVDFILRLYAAHVFIIPMFMLILVFIHFPRYLVFDIPVVSTVVGGILTVAAIFPVALGIPYSPTNPQITIPEWYLTGLYALLRTEYDKFVMGILLPTLLLLMFIVVPFIDTSKKLSWKDRPFFTGLGVTSIAQIIVTTTWGFYVDPNTQASVVINGKLVKGALARLYVPPTLYFSSMIGVTVLSFVLTYVALRYIKSRERVRKAAAPLGPMLTRKWVFVLFALLIFGQVALNGLAVMAFNQGLNTMALFDVGAVLISFGLVMHLYRYSQNLPF